MHLEGSTWDGRKRDLKVGAMSYTGCLGPRVTSRAIVESKTDLNALFRFEQRKPR